MTIDGYVEKVETENKKEWLLWPARFKVYFSVKIEQISKYMLHVSSLHSKGIWNALKTNIIGERGKGSGIEVKFA